MLIGLVNTDTNTDTNTNNTDPSTNISTDIFPAKLPNESIGDWCKSLLVVDHDFVLQGPAK